jgi:hypothetical protein
MRAASERPRGSDMNAPRVISRLEVQREINEERGKAMQAKGFMHLSRIVAVLTAFVMSASGIVPAHGGGRHLEKSRTVPTLMAGGGTGSGGGVSGAPRSGSGTGSSSGKVQKPKDSGKSDIKTDPSTVTPKEGDTAQALRG